MFSGPEVLFKTCVAMKFLDDDDDDDERGLMLSVPKTCFGDKYIPGVSFCSEGQWPLHFYPNNRFWGAT